MNAYRSRLVRVADQTVPVGVAPDPGIVADVVAPLEADIERFFGVVLADLQVPLDGRRETSRSVETNLGNLLADSYSWAAGESIAAGAPGFEDVPEDRPRVAFTNGGGIRNEDIVAPGEFTRLDTVEIAAFDNRVFAHPLVTGEQLTALLDYALGPVDWAQISGVTVEVDRDAPEGERIRELALDDGTVVVAGGELVGGDVEVALTSIDFLLAGGSGYPFEDVGLAFEDAVEVVVDGESGLLYSQVLEEYVTADTGLAGVITAQDYPEGGEGRVTQS